MKRKSHGGDKPPFYTTHIHLGDDTELSVDVVMEETPLLTIGGSGHEVTLFFMGGRALDRVIAALTDLRKGSKLIGMTWNTYVDTTPEIPPCPVHGSTCRPVWHKADQTVTLANVKS
jgi:hypothetical protein